MAGKNRSETRKSILIYPEAKDKFDEVHRMMGGENASQTVEALVEFYRSHNEKVQV